MSGALPGERFAACEALVRKVDYDRYLASLFAPAHLRAHLFALYAVNHEIAKTAERVTQPLAGQIRLQWWRDSLDGALQGRAPRHETAMALEDVLRAHALPRARLEALIDSHENDLHETPFADLSSLEAYADATAGNLMRLALAILGARPDLTPELEHAARAAGIAYGLTGLLRALPFHASRRRLMLPLALLTQAGLSAEDVFAGRSGSALTGVMAAVARRAREHLIAARRIRFPRELLPAILPAALVPLYLRMLTRPGFDPYRDMADVPVYRRQLAMLCAVVRGTA